MKKVTVYAEFTYFALMHINNQHVHHLVIGCSKKKIRPTYPIFKKSVTGNKQLIFSGLTPCVTSSCQKISANLITVIENEMSVCKCFVTN